MDPINISLFYFNENVPSLMINSLNDIIGRVFSTAQIKMNDQLHEVKLKWDIRLISSNSETANVPDGLSEAEKDKLPKKCDILAVYSYSLGVGRPDYGQFINEVMWNSVKLGCIEKHGALLFLSVLSGGVTMHENAMKLAHGKPDFEENEKNSVKFPEGMKKYPLRGCSIDANPHNKEAIVGSILSSVTNKQKIDAYSDNFFELKNIVNAVAQEKFKRINEQRENNQNKAPKPSQPSNKAESLQLNDQPKNEFDILAKINVWKSVFPDTFTLLPGEKIRERGLRLKKLIEKFECWIKENETHIEAKASENEDERAKFLRHLKLYKERGFVPSVNSAITLEPTANTQHTQTKQSESIVRQETSTQAPSSVQPTDAATASTQHTQASQSESIVRQETSTQAPSSVQPTAAATASTQQTQTRSSEPTVIIPARLDTPTETLPTASSALPEQESLPLPQPIATGRFALLKVLFKKVGKGFKAISRIITATFKWFVNWIKKSFNS